MAARPTLRSRVVATVSQPVIESERKAAANNLRFRQCNERGVNVKARTLDASASRQRCQRLEGADEFRATVGIARVVERIDSDEEVVGIERLCPAKCNREKN